MWAALWFVLVLVAVVVIALLGRRLFRQAKALTAELSTASERLAEVSQALGELADARDLAADDPMHRRSSHRAHRG